MTHHLPRQHQQQVQRCNVCALFQSMGGQYRSVYDRDVYLQHLQTAHADRRREEPESHYYPRGVAPGR